jgi:hypothetical protein
MKSITKSLAALTLLVGLATTPAMAVEPGGAEIKGKVNQSVKVDNAVNAAIGNGARAGLSAAAVHSGSKVGGDVTQSVKAKNLVNAAIGNGARACMSLASVGDSAACR